MSDPIVKTFPARKQYTNKYNKKQEGPSVPSSAKLRAKLVVWSKHTDISSDLQLYSPHPHTNPHPTKIFSGRGGNNIWKLCFSMKLNSENQFDERKNQEGSVFNLLSKFV